MPTPEARGRGGRDRDPALLLLLHPVHRGGAIVDLADLVALAGIEKNALGRRRLPGIDVRHDADVPVMLERCGPWHICRQFVVACVAWGPPLARQARKTLAQQKRGWIRRSLSQEPVSIRHRRVHSHSCANGDPRRIGRLSG
jgi:hypothetical protein